MKRNGGNEAEDKSLVAVERVRRRVPGGTVGLPRELTEPSKGYTQHSLRAEDGPERRDSTPSDSLASISGRPRQRGTYCLVLQTQHNDPI